MRNKIGVDSTPVIQIQKSEVGQNIEWNCSNETIIKGRIKRKRELIGNIAGGNQLWLRKTRRPVPEVRARSRDLSLF